MIELKLDDEEASILAEVVENDLSDLRMEIAHTDSYNFRKGLRRRKAVLMKVVESLAGPPAPLAAD